MTRVGDGVRHHRPAGEEHCILAGQALAAGASEDHGRGVRRRMGKRAGHGGEEISGGVELQE